MNDHWLSFSLTPVQGFIEASRTVRDLAVGSTLICTIVGAALQACRQQGGAALFPVTSSSAVDMAIPNQFVWMFATRAEADAAQTAAETAARQTWRHLATEVRTLLTPWGSGWDTGWPEQIERYWDIRTIVLSQGECPLEVCQRLFPGRPGHADSLRRQWQILAAAQTAGKQVRQFQPHPFPEGLGKGRSKCTLLGEWEQMGPVGEAQLATFWKAHSDFARAGGRIGARDRLSAVALVKRFAPAVSSATPALLHWRASVRDTADIVAGLWCAQAKAAVSAEWHAFETAASALNQELGPAPEGLARLLLEDSLRFSAFQKELPTLQEASATPLLEGLAQARAKLFQATRAAGLGAPPRYLAVLAVDGDQMGRRLSGDFCAPGEYDARFFAVLSERLQRFAEQAPGLVAAAQGVHIYAGGDDALALVPLSESLSCLTALHTAFAALGLPGADKKATLSGGLAIFHYKHDLRDALRQVRAAEQDAKAFGRDAVSLRLIKRSGGDIAATVDWRQLEPLAALSALFQQGAGSRWVSRFARHLSALDAGTEEAQAKLLLDYWLNRTEGAQASEDAARGAGTEGTGRDALIREVNLLWQEAGDFLHQRHSNLRPLWDAVGRNTDSLPTRTDGEGFTRLVCERLTSLVGIASFLTRGTD